MDNIEVIEDVLTGILSGAFESPPDVFYSTCLPEVEERIGREVFVVFANFANNQRRAMFFPLAQASFLVDFKQIMFTQFDGGLRMFGKGLHSKGEGDSEIHFWEIYASDDPALVDLCP